MKSKRKALFSLTLVIITALLMALTSCNVAVHTGNITNTDNSDNSTHDSNNQVIPEDSDDSGEPENPVEPEAPTEHHHSAAEPTIENKVSADCENPGGYDTVIYCVALLGQRNKSEGYAQLTCWSLRSFVFS